MKENITIPFFWQHVCKIFVINAILGRGPRSDISNILHNHWKCVHSLHCVVCIVL